jgi:hypothetical protein
MGISPSRTYDCQFDVAVTHNSHVSHYDFALICVFRDAYSCEWTSAHFGYPNNTRFYQTDPPVPRYFKIFTPNPTLMPDGKTWEVHYGDIEVTFYLAEDIRERFEEILQNNARCLGMPGEVEFV